MEIHAYAIQYRRNPLLGVNDKFSEWRVSENVFHYEDYEDAEMNMVALESTYEGGWEYRIVKVTTSYEVME